ncbi:AfsR/SARP family transcriptional regulator [Rugosimonospora africana]|uniref:SARP family transcriptional regulator n=1 Tax=Rugosimonospora africana TaxID=556532 RepID=A0A8J3R2J9_9ACTN|nr:AfsR/SARP family transcriptional regulator [Rugosimonospora africana]GIH20498.1 SARP family transcriptional regulator [Rugosimonospora africana]
METPIFGILGPLSVRMDGVEVPIAAAKLRVFLAVLLLRTPQAVTIDELTDLLWEDRLPRKARAALNTYVGRLRQMLGPLGGRIRTVPAGYVIDLRADELDLARFLELRVTGQAKAAEGGHAAAAKVLRSALGLWRGEPLADVASSRLQRGDGHVLTQLRVSAWEACLDAEIADGRPQDVLGDLTQLLAAYPLHERFHEQLITALHRTGRRADALAAFQATRAIFVEELGVEPGAALQRLQQAILTEGAGPATSPVAVRGRATVVPAQLPADLGDFTGRASSVSALCRALAADPARSDATPVVAAVTGAGGAGKTTLAVHVGHRVRGGFPDGQLYVSMRGSSEFPMDPGEVAGRLLRELGVDPAQVPADQTERFSLYRSLLADRRTLLVFDDVRDTVQIRPLLPGSTRSAVIVTSRDELATLPTKIRVGADLMDDETAAALFAAIVGRQRAGAEPGAVDRVLRVCAGLPLAIRIAAARVAARPDNSIQTLADRLADVRSRLDQFDLDDLGIRASFMASYARLPDSTRAATMFRTLGLWPGPDIGLAGMGALIGNGTAVTGSAVDALVASHLVQCPAPDRYRLHDLIHVYARERTEHEDPPATRQAAMERLLAWYLHAASNAADLIRPHHLPIPIDPAPAGVTALVFDDHAAALDWCQLEQANLIAAVRLAASAGSYGVAWQLALTLWSYYYVAKIRDDWTAASEIGLACARLAADRRAEGALLACLGTALCENRRYDEAIDHYQQALDLHRETGDAQREPVTLNSLAVVYGERGQFQLARDTFAEVRTLHARSGNRHGVGLAIANMALCFAELGDADAAIRHNHEALGIYREVGDHYSEAITLGNIGDVYASTGAYHRASEALTAAITLHETVGNRHGQARALVTLGRNQNTAGEHAAARRSWRAAMQIFEDLNDPEAAEPRDLLDRVDTMQL